MITFIHVINYILKDVSYMINTFYLFDIILQGYPGGRDILLIYNYDIIQWKA